MTPESELSSDLLDEISALNCIYGEDCITGPLSHSTNTASSATTITLPSTSSPNDQPRRGKNHIFLLHPPDLPQPLTFRISIPTNYPSGGEAPGVISLSVEGRRRWTQNNTGRREKEEAEELWLSLSRDIMQQVYETNGGASVCLYEFIEGVKEILPSPPEEELTVDEDNDQNRPTTPPPLTTISPAQMGWYITPSVTEKKSVFIGHAIRLTPDLLSSLPDVSSLGPTDNPTTHIRHLITNLISSDKRLQKATHNISAYRYRRGSDGAIFQDNDDDGETAAGARLGHLLAVMEVWDVCVVVARWYGGIKLGGDRFRIIGNVAREAVVGALGGSGGGDVGKDKEGKEKGKGGKKGKR